MAKLPEGAPTEPKERRRRLGSASAGAGEAAGAQPRRVNRRGLAAPGGRGGRQGVERAGAGRDGSAPIWEHVGNGYHDSGSGPGQIRVYEDNAGKI